MRLAGTIQHGQASARIDEVPLSVDIDSLTPRVFVTGQSYPTSTI